MPHYGESHPEYPSLFWNGRYWDLKRARAKADDKCKVVFCRNLVYYECRRNPDGSTKMVTHHTCTKCRARRWRVNNPDKAAFKDIRHSAKLRKIPFSMTFEFFRQLCEDTGYLLFKGSEATHLQIDRIDASRGYSDDNVQIITCSENVAKGNRERYLPDYVKALRSRTEGFELEEEIPEVDGALCPF